MNVDTTGDGRGCCVLCGRKGGSPDVNLTTRTCKTDTMIFQRILARIFVILGIVFTFWMGFGLKYAYQGQPLGQAAAFGLFLSAGLIVIFVVGLFYELIAAVLLGVGALAIIVWGVVAGWSAGAWGAMVLILVAPMVASALLYYFAAAMQKTCELQGVKV
jgi:hypothetical protein